MNSTPLAKIFIGLAAVGAAAYGAQLYLFAKPTPKSAGDFPIVKVFTLQEEKQGFQPRGDTRLPRIEYNVAYPPASMGKDVFAAIIGEDGRELKLWSGENAKVGIVSFHRIGYPYAPKSPRLVITKAGRTVLEQPVKEIPRRRERSRW